MVSPAALLRPVKLLPSHVIVWKLGVSTNVLFFIFNTVPAGTRLKTQAQVF